MKNSLILIVLGLSSFSYSQDSIPSTNDKKVVAIVDRFTQITGPDGDCTDELSALRLQLEEQHRLNKSLTEENETLQDSVAQAMKTLYISEKNFLIEKYGKEDTRSEYGVEQYNDFKNNYFLREYTNEHEGVLVFFPLNKSKADFEMYSELKELAEQYHKNKGSKIEINAYTDSRGSEERNSELSEERAKEIRNYLVKVLKVHETDISISGKGSNSKDRIPEADLDFLNRRAVVKLIL